MHFLYGSARLLGKPAKGLCVFESPFLLYSHCHAQKACAVQPVSPNSLADYDISPYRSLILKRLHISVPSVSIVTATIDLTSIDITQTPRVCVPKIGVSRQRSETPYRVNLFPLVISIILALYRRQY